MSLPLWNIDIWRNFVTIALATLLLAGSTAATQTESEFKPWRVGMNLSGHFCAPSGSIYEGREPGLGYEADLVVALTHRFALRGTVSYSGIQAEEDLAHPLLIAPDEYLIFDNYKFSSMGYFLSFEYYHQPGPGESGNTIYHVYSGFGIVTHHTELYEVYRSGGSVIFRNPVDISENVFASTLGGMITYMLGPVVGVHAGARFEFVWPGNVGDYDEYWDIDISNSNRLNLKVGLTIFIR